MNKIWLVFLLAATLTVSSCAQNGSRPNQPRNDSANNSAPANKDQKASTDEDCPICNYDFAGYAGELNKTEVNGLLLALNDEYRATSIYQQINADFGDPRPFVNIVVAEMRHAARLKEILTNYKLDIPANPWPGKVPKFNSVAEACKAGIEAEIDNSKLYDRILESTKRDDILVVYRALQRASVENHLPAFKRCGGGRFN